MKLFLLLSVFLANSAALPPDTGKKEAQKKPAATNVAKAAAPVAKPTPKKVRPTGPMLPSILIVDF